jgi:hypothetical protein
MLSIRMLHCAGPWLQHVYPGLALVRVMLAYEARVGVDTGISVVCLVPLASSS